MQEREESRALKREKRMSREGKVREKYVYGKERKKNRKVKKYIYLCVCVRERE
jgi:hypothetical protein